MAKKSWFSQLKRFFVVVTNSKPEKEKRRRSAFSRFKIKRLPSVSEPTQLRERPVSESDDEQNKHDITVAIATDEVGRFNGNIAQSVHRCKDKCQEFLAVDVEANASKSTQLCETGIQDIAATRIQTAFRGYLARKALRALKGLVRLQAIIRGRAVRRQAITTLKCLQSIVTIQSEVCARRFQMVEGTRNFHENKDLQDFKDKIDSDSNRRWDDSILSRDEANALFLSKREAAVKRERIKEYSLSHRRSTETEQNNLNGRWRYWLEQWVDTQLSKNSDTVFPPNTRIREEIKGHLKPRNSHKQHYVEGLEFDSPIPRRSFHHKKQKSMGEDNNFTNSPVIVPTYMAATESAKAKARSMSSPRLRGISLNAYSETDSPYKHKLSPISSINSEVTSSGKIFLGEIRQRSPCLKSLPGPVKSSRSLKDLSFNSECSFSNWDRNVTVK